MEGLTLRMGERGNEVNKLQQMLKSLDYYVPGTGLFDYGTFSALKAFQNDFGLKVNGMVDTRVWQALDMALKRRHAPGDSHAQPGITRSIGREEALQQEVYDIYKAEPSELPPQGGIPDSSKAPPKPETYIFLDNTPQDAALQTPAAIEETLAINAATRPTLRQGNVGQDVAHLQQALQVLGFYNGALDAIFGSQTAAAVRAFQRANALTEDGVVGPKTWAALEGAPAAMVRSSDSGWAGRPILRQGSSGNYVKDLQHALTRLGYYTGYIDGVFGDAVASGVREFQSDNNLKPDSIVGPLTWAALEKAVSRPPSPEDIGPVLREGASGDDVENLQKKLWLLGYFFGPITGNYGQETTGAVRLFQHDNALTPDGIAGPRTWSLINKEAAAKRLAPASRIPLRRGNTGENVSKLQRELNMLGYYNGPMSGVLDVTTEAALNAFLESSGLPPHDFGD